MNCNDSKIKCKEMKKSGGKNKYHKRNPRREKRKKRDFKKIMSIYTRIFMKIGGEKLRKMREIKKTIL